jgi:hypothetical protein
VDALGLLALGTPSIEDFSCHVREYSKLGRKNTGPPAVTTQAPLTNALEPSRPALLR